MANNWLKEDCSFRCSSDAWYHAKIGNVTDLVSLTTTATKPRQCPASGFSCGERSFLHQLDKERFIDTLFISSFYGNSFLLD